MVPACATTAFSQEKVNWEQVYNGPGALGVSDIGKWICTGPDGRGTDRLVAQNSFTFTREATGE